MIISFNGFPGTGKSTVAKRLADELGWTYYDMGGLRRTMAAKRGLTIEEYNKLGETDPTTDTEVEAYQEDLGKTQDNFIIVGRLSWHFIPHSLKIFLTARPEVSAERILHDLERRNEPSDLKTIEDVQGMLERRYASDEKRFTKYYGVQLYNQSDYDWVLDTSDLTQEEVYQALRSYVMTKIEEQAGK